jgi:hypothetical protein
VRPALMIEPDDMVVFLTLEGEALSQSHLTKLVRSYIKASGIGKPALVILFGIQWQR